MKSLLVPTDFSPASHNAIDYAAQLANQLNASLLLFHAYMIPTPVSEVSYAMLTIDEIQEANERNIKREAEHIRSAYGLEVEYEVRIGIASDEIKILAAEKGIDLVIMGMKGAGSLDKIIGSTTINVIRKVKTPVLVIPHDATYSPVKDIAYTSDFNAPSSLTLFNPLLEIAHDFQPAIHILHVEKTNGHNGGDELVNQRELENVFGSYSHDYVTVKDESVTHGINEYLQDHPCNLLVMVAHKHTFLDRIFSKDNTTAMAYETRIPLLVLQDKE